MRSIGDWYDRVTSKIQRYLEMELIVRVIVRAIFQARVFISAERLSVERLLQRVLVLVSLRVYASAIAATAKSCLFMSAKYCVMKCIQRSGGINLK